MNPLRYPGSKASLTDYIAAIIEDNLLPGCTIYEPYAGSAIVSLEMIRRCYSEKAVLIERDPLIYSFWKAVFTYTEELIKMIKEVDVSLNTWNLFQPYREIDNIKNCSIVELGLAGLFFNRTNFSGIIGAGPIGGCNQSSQYNIDCRFNKNRIIEQIIKLSKYHNRVDVVYDDAISYMKKHEHEIEDKFSFVYIDPPYYMQGKKIYRYHYDKGDHENLAKYILSQKFPWLVSYDDHPTIRELYSSSLLQQIYIDYSIRTSRQGSELLISNLLIPPISIVEGSVIEAG